MPFQITFFDIYLTNYISNVLRKFKTGSKIIPSLMESPKMHNLMQLKIIDGMTLKKPCSSIAVQ